MKFRVKTSWVADADVLRILSYIRQHSRQGAISWFRALKAARRRLAEAADTFSESPEAEHFGLPLKEVPFKTRRGVVYRIVFKVGDEEVLILRIRGPGQGAIDPSESNH